MRVFLIGVMAVLVSGCMSLDSPINGDYGILERQRDYCTESSPYARAAALAVIRSQVPGYPASGLCTDADQALADEVARQSEGLPEMDVESAREDQERFRAVPE